jgi:hypothetical protein
MISINLGYKQSCVTGTRAKMHNLHTNPFCDILANRQTAHKPPPNNYIFGRESEKNFKQ